VGNPLPASPFFLFSFAYVFPFHGYYTFDPASQGLTSCSFAKKASWFRRYVSFLPNDTVQSPFPIYFASIGVRGTGQRVKHLGVSGLFFHLLV
jgi:hypothetical protein